MNELCEVAGKFDENATCCIIDECVGRSVCVELRLIGFRTVSGISLTSFSALLHTNPFFCICIQSGEFG